MTTTGKKKLKIFLILVIIFVAILGISIALLGKYANQIVKSELERRLGKNFSVERIDLAWGRVEAVGVSLKNAAGKEVIKIDSLALKAGFMGYLKKEYIISNMILKAPYIFVEVDGKGNIINPVLPVEPKETKPAKAAKPEQPSPPIIVKKIEIKEGAIDYLDRKTPKTPVLTKLRSLNLVMKNIAVPFTDIFSDYVLSVSVLGNMSTGAIKSSGRINLMTRDMDSKGEIRKLDMTTLKPYFQKDNPINITRGFLDLDITTKVVSKKIHAPGNAVLKDLAFQDGPGRGNQFMGVPLALVVGALKTNNNEIPINFIIDGNLDNPKFNLQEEFMRRLAMGLAGSLGFSVEGIGQSLLGGGVKGGENVGTSIKDIEEGLRKILKK
ncbi:MAG: hypothetical protein C0399_13100 [Syntrophus sp. (in: bacteria)]|nr:hypothetical protein [Syntrophus sp. (in: bacteria)]